MIKHARHSLVLLAVIALTALIAASCSDNGTRATFDRAGVRITMEKTSLAAEAASVELEVRMVANDSLVHEDEAEVVDGQFEFAPFELPAGQAEFTARALDSDGGLLYAGSVTATIIGGANNQVALTLTPAVPMVRIAPYITDANTEAAHVCFLELHNLSAFAAGTFFLMYDSDFLSFSSATQASTAWGTLTINPSPSDLGMQLTVTRTPNAGDAIPSGVVQLVRLTFDPLIAGRTTIDVSVSRLINAAGQSIPELTTLRTDYQTVDITEGTPTSSSMAGTVVDAQSGEPVVGANVTISGPTQRQTSTTIDGSFLFENIPLGEYLLRITASNFIEFTQDVTVGAEPVNVPVAISQQLGDAQYRITLSWGEVPSDLDAHLLSGDYWVYFGNPGSPDPGTPPFIFLDRDDTDSFGPETVTIFDLSAPATFHVHNFSGDPDIKQSSAHVNVYRGDALVNSYDIPRSGEGVWWHVFNIDGNGNIVTQNVIDNIPPAAPGAVVQLPATKTPRNP